MLTISICILDNTHKILTNFCVDSIKCLYVNQIHVCLFVAVLVGCASSMALLMAIGRLILHFGPGWNISTNDHEILCRFSWPLEQGFSNSDWGPPIRQTFEQGALVYLFSCAQYLEAYGITIMLFDPIDTQQWGQDSLILLFDITWDYTKYITNRSLESDSP